MQADVVLLREPLEERLQAFVFRAGEEHQIGAARASDGAAGEEPPRAQPTVANASSTVRTARSGGFMWSPLLGNQDAAKAVAWAAAGGMILAGRSRFTSRIGEAQ